MSTRIFATAAVGLCMGVQEGTAQCVTEVVEDKLTASDGEASDKFGCSVAISGGAALLGAYKDDDKGSNAGAAYICRLVGGAWVEEQKLTASDGAANDKFGVTVALAGDVAVIGAWGDDDLGASSGSAYVFRFNGSSWVQEQKLVASDGAVNDFFGIAVAASPQVVVVSSFSDQWGYDAGAAYVFRHNGSVWVQEAKLGTPSGGQGHLFGTSVGVSGNVIAAGAPDANFNGGSSGAAYVFRYNGTSWTQEAQLLAADGAYFDKFGQSISVSGNMVAVGAYNDGSNSGINGHGAVYMFEFNGSSWFQDAKLLASDGQSGDLFGGSVSVAGNRLLAGAHLHDAVAYNAGAAYLFEHDGTSWSESGKIVTDDGAVNDNFGRTVSVDGAGILVGAENDDDMGIDSGSGYTFVETVAGADPGDCNNNGMPDGCDIALGQSQDQNGDGVPDECQTGMPGDVTGDGIVNVADLTAMVASWGACSGCAADLNGDGAVTVIDLVMLVELWS